jgi:hypothetical protein
VRVRILFLALALSFAQTSAIANPKSSAMCTKACTPALGPTGWYVYKYVSGKQQRKDITGKWQKRDLRPESSFDPIRVAAYKAIYALPTDPQAVNFKFDYTIKEGYPKSIESLIKLQLNQIAKRLSPILAKTEIAKIFFITEKDKNWARTELNKLVPENEYLGALEILDFYNTKERFYSRGGTGGGVAGFIPEKNYSFYISHTSSFATTETYWPEVVPHEFTHMLQGILSGGISWQSGVPEGSPESKWNGHFIEGSANTLGMALGFESLGWYSDEMDRLLKRDIKTHNSWKKVQTQADAVAFIKAIEVRNSEPAFEFSYSAGQVVWEYFIGKYGMSKFLELLRNIPKTPNYNENLKTTIGKDRDAFYQEAGAYLLKNWQRLS